MSQRIYCGVPAEHCCGAIHGVNKTLPKIHPSKTHNSAPEAFNCHKRYLLKMGFKQVGQREFQDPADGYIKVLTKKSHFGTPVRKGKGGEKGEKTKRCTFMRIGGAIAEA